MSSEAAAPDKCVRCSRNAVLCRIRVFVGKLSLRESGILDSVERYEGTTLELPVCTWCYRLYHLRDDLEGRVMWLVVIVPIGYGIWGYATNLDQSMIVAYVVGTLLFMMLLIGLFMTVVTGKILRWFSGPERFARKHPGYSKLKARGFTEVFYIDRKGTPESKLTFEIEDLQ